MHFMWRFVPFVILHISAISSAGGKLDKYIHSHIRTSSDHFLTSDPYPRTLWSARSVPHDSTYSPDKSIDNVRGHHDAFGVSWNYFSWIEYDFAEVVANIYGVLVVKRDGVEDRMTNYEVRIGDDSLPEGTYQTPITTNELCNSFGAGTTDATAWFDCVMARSGRYWRLTDKKGKSNSCFS